MSKIFQAYDYLRSTGYTLSQEHFSVSYLRKSPRYFSMLKASPDRVPSIEAIGALAAHLERLAETLSVASTPDVRNRSYIAKELAVAVWDELRARSLA